MKITNEEITGFVPETEWNDLLDEATPYEEIHTFECTICSEEFDTENEVRDHVVNSHSKGILKHDIAQTRKTFFQTVENYKKKFNPNEVI